MKDFIIYIIIYYILISLYAALLTVIDKSRALRRKRRIQENALFGVGVLGGAAAMYLTMKLIHHKTRVKRFMVYLPFIAFAHLAVIIFFTALAID